MSILVSNPDLPTISFFGDASSRNKKFMVAGGIAVAGNRIKEIDEEIAALRTAAGIKSEFHWADYRGGNRRSGYERLIAYAFSLIKQQKAALHIIVANFEAYDHKLNGRDGKDASINKMYFQLLLHRVARFYGKSRAIHVRLDAGNDSKDICSLRNQLCAQAYARYKTAPNCVRSIEPVCSRRVGIVQMADVLVGAIAAKVNDVQHTSPKGDLANFALEASGRTSWKTNTPYEEKLFTIWHHTARVGPPQHYLSNAEHGCTSQRIRVAEA